MPHRRLRHPLALLAAACLAAACLAAALPAQSPAREGAGASRRGTVETRALDMFERQRLWKAINDQYLFAELGPEMIARKVQYAAEDGMIIPAYLFAPRDTTVRRPVLVYVHGGVHADFSAGHAPDVRALVREGYIIIAPEYRGSTGYGKAFYDAIDYGGKEVEDVIAAVDYLAAEVPFADTSRVALMGASHGGFIAIHAALRRPDRFRAVVAQVPVADLPARIRTHDEAYHRIFAAQPGFGGRLEHNFRKYWDRSPIAHVRELRTPLLVQAATNDEDVFIVENRNLRDSMVVAGKDREGLYTYREWTDPPGGHSFVFMPTPEGCDAWTEGVAFLRKYLLTSASSAAPPCALPGSRPSAAGTRASPRP